jgi:hypothetical protein
MSSVGVKLGATIATSTPGKFIVADKECSIAIGSHCNGTYFLFVCNTYEVFKKTGICI